MANKRFDDTLRALRNAKGYTQQQAADLLGLKNKSTLGSWEVGKSEPDGYTLLKLCKLYEVEDIYAAFHEISPRQLPLDTTASIEEQYGLLNDAFKKLVRSQIELLLQIQQEYDNR